MTFIYYNAKWNLNLKLLVKSKELRAKSLFEEFFCWNQYAISELPLASVSKWVHVQNHSYEVFDLHENEHACKTLWIWKVLHMDSFWNGGKRKSEMTYLKGLAFLKVNFIQATRKKHSFREELTNFQNGQVHPRLI